MSVQIKTIKPKRIRCPFEIDTISKGTDGKIYADIIVYPSAVLPLINASDIRERFTESGDGVPTDRELCDDYFCETSAVLDPSGTYTIFINVVSDIYETYEDIDLRGCKDVSGVITDVSKIKIPDIPDFQSLFISMLKEVFKRDKGWLDETTENEVRLFIRNISNKA